MRFRVKNWKQFQHYKGRRPPWIKLHRDILDDFDFCQLPLASQALAPRLWLLASESEDGSIPSSPAQLAFRLRCTPADVEAAIKPLLDARFLIADPDASASLAACKQEPIPETEKIRDRDRDRGETEQSTAAASHPSGLTPEQRQEYAHAITEAWGEKRGAPVMVVSPVDGDVIDSLMVERVPLRVALQGIADCSKPPKPTTPLTYAVPAIRDENVRWRKGMSA